MTGDEITRKLQAWLQGDRSALDQLLPFLTANMRAIARRMPKAGPTLNTTALVNEAWMRLAGADFLPSDREHFLAVVARAMRQILIDHARGRLRAKRGAGAVRVTLDNNSVLTDAQIEQALMIDELLDRLETEHPRRCRVFEMRFFAGFSVAEIAEALALSENTIISDYRLACAWLRTQFGISPMNRDAMK
jgi:RNA polymerase sigma factor (TIGR02999 family)